MLSIIAQVDPLPLVPATWMTESFESSSSRPSLCELDRNMDIMDICVMNEVECGWFD